MNKSYHSRKRRISSARNQLPLHQKGRPFQLSHTHAHHRISKATADDGMRRRSARDNEKSMSEEDVSLSDVEKNLDCDGDIDVEMDTFSEDSGFYWEEEETLLSDLMDGFHRKDNGQYLDTLADSLQTPFTEQGNILKKEIAETLVPTHNRVKAVFSILDKTVDPGFGQGISKFNEACKKIEISKLAQKDDFNEAHIATQKKIEKLLEELKAEYTKRDKLWVELKISISGIVNPVLDSISDTPAKIEQAIVKLDKQAKSIEASFKDMSSVRKGLQDLLKAA